MKNIYLLKLKGGNVHIYDYNISINHAIYKGLSFISEGKPKFLLDWKSVKERFSWDVLLLIGGGFALADTTMVNINRKFYSYNVHTLFGI